MAELPTPDECGRKILGIFANDNIRPGEMMLIQSIRARFLDSGNRAIDLATGLDWLIQQELLRTEDNMKYFLTEPGFAAI